MAKFRYINTKFWNDNFITNLDPLEKFLFLYFLTNEHTNIAGIYELPLRVMAFETGIDKETLPKMIERFEGKIYYMDGWVFIKNFLKHQELKSKTIKNAVLTIIDTLPIGVMESIYRVCGGYDDPPRGYHILISILKPILKSKFNSLSSDDDGKDLKKKPI